MNAIEVDLWQWRLTAADPADLSPQEVERAERFVFERDKMHFIAGRAGLRRILADYLEQPAGQLCFEYGPHGKPALAGIEFNLSHTGDLAVLAVSENVTLGADVETIRPIDMAVAELHFAPSEIQTLRNLPNAEQQAAFFRCWTRKEAYLKARGTGLWTDLNSFSVSIDAESAELLECSSGGSAAWTLVDIDVPDGTAGALAVRANRRDVKVVRCEMKNLAGS